VYYRNSVETTSLLSVPSIRVVEDWGDDPIKEHECNENVGLGPPRRCESCIDEFSIRLDSAKSHLREAR
jgi:hypothetical protein